MMIRFKEIRLLPTIFNLHAYIVGDRDNNAKITDKNRRFLSNHFHKKYGSEFEYYYGLLKRIDFVITFYPTEKSETKGETTILIVISPCLTTLVHELTHVLWHLADEAALEMDYKSQEWQAGMYEYLFTELKDFRKIPSISSPSPDRM